MNDPTTSNKRKNSMILPYGTIKQAKQTKPKQTTKIAKQTKKNGQGDAQPMFRFQYIYQRSFSPRKHRVSKRNVQEVQLKPENKNK